MKSNKTLFLFTKTFPFGGGEQYLNAGLPYLAAKFNKVIIYPNDYYSSEITHDNLLPNNVFVLNFNQKFNTNTKNNIGDYFYLLKILFTELIETDDLKYYFKNFKWNLINFWTQYQIANLFSKYLKNNNYNSNNSVFYSYWLHKSVILLSILKDKKQINKFVSRAHSIDLYHNDWGIINNEVKVPPFKLFKLKHTDAVFTVSEHGANYLKSKHKKFSDKIFTKYLGVKINDFNIDKPKSDVFHIVTCSYLDSNKRIHLLAKALKSITFPVKWTHFGYGSFQEIIEDEISNFPPNVSAKIMGTTPNKDILQFYAKNDIHLFVNLSIVEGLPVSIMEAMAFEIPILATAVYGTPEAVIENENGFLLDVNFTQEQLIEKINYCINHKEQLKLMGNKSRNIYLEKFNSEKNYTEFANYLATL